MVLLLSALLILHPHTMLKGSPVTQDGGTPTAITIHTDQPGHAISPSLYGVFFEEINHAGDGGLNAELLRNFNLREPQKQPGVAPGWSPVGEGVQIGEDRVILTCSPAGTPGARGGTAVDNTGYWGIPVEAGAKFRFDIHAESATSTPVSVRLLSKAGDVLAETAVIPGTPASAYKGTLTAKGSDPAARLEVGLDQAGSATILSASLMPVATYKGHGLRDDLAEKVAEIHPNFVRFPGGCYVEGGDFLRNRFDWQKTMMPPANRPGHLNDIWNYWSTDRLGYREYLQWCEDMGSDALFVVNCGFSHKETVPMDALDPYLTSTMDALEYALGTQATPWGRRRAADGHPAPYPLKYVEVGNENGQDWTGGGTHQQYAERYDVFAKAIKAKYPQITLVADTRHGTPLQVVDDHYYNSPTWFWQNVGLYDHADRKGPKVYVGEYAVTSDCGHGNLKAALAEAAFMTGLERNSDLVTMASYAPLFVNTNDRAWNPDAIVFDGKTSYGTPSYYVQQLFSQNRPDVYLPSDAPTYPAETLWGGTVGVGTWLTQAEFSDVTVHVAGQPVVNGSTSTWTPKAGTWTATNGTETQTSNLTDAMTILQSAALQGATDYTMHLKAKKTGGDEGFLVLFRVHDADQFFWWNIGGWGNTGVAVEATSGGGHSMISRRLSFKVETGRLYDIEITVKGSTLTLVIDGKPVQTVKLGGAPTLAVEAGTVTKTGDLIIKVVNGSDTDRPSLLELDGFSDRRWNGTVTTMTSAAQSDENSLANPNKIVPLTAKIYGEKHTVAHTFPARSLTIIRIHPTEGQ